MIFFETLVYLKSENLKLNKGRQNPDGCLQTFAATDDVLWFFGFSNSEEHKSVSGHSQISLPLFRGYSWHQKPKQKDTRELLQKKHHPKLKETKNIGLPPNNRLSLTPFS